MTEEQLDVALSKVCLNFDEVHYEKLQDAYGLLGKTQVGHYFETYYLSIHMHCFIYYFF